MLTNQDKTFQTNSDTSSTSAELSEKTIIIFDFDDTLFCTKYLETFSLCYEDIFKSKVSLEELNPCLYKEIKELENEIIELFITLKQFYDVIIISNADIKWINNCLIHFLDELREYIVDNDIKIFSAKNNKIRPKDDFLHACLPFNLVFPSAQCYFFSIIKAVVIIVIKVTISITTT